jgi:hypothetical protein
MRNATPTQAFAEAQAVVSREANRLLRSAGSTPAVRTKPQFLKVKR